MIWLRRSLRVSCRMVTLSLLRHAKSSWSDALLKDFERPLNGRGMQAAPRIGTFMALFLQIPIDKMT